MAILSKAAANAARVLGIFPAAFQQLANWGLQGYALIWSDPTARPQDVIAALGTNAAATFGFANLNLTTIASAATIGGVTAPSIPELPGGWSLTFNNDGSAGVTLPPATVPAGVTVTNGSGGATIAWTAITGALSYSVQKSVDNGATFQPLMTVTTRLIGGGQVPVTPCATSCVDTLAVAGNQYQVAVTTPAGISAWSVEVTL